MSTCFPPDCFDDPRVLSLSDGQYRKWINLCRLAARGRVSGRIPAYPGAGLARALRTQQHHLQRALDVLAGLELVERLEGGALWVTPFEAPAPAAEAAAIPPPEAPVAPDAGLEGLSRTELYRTYGTTSLRKIKGSGLAAPNGNASVSNGRNGHAAGVPQNVSQNVSQNVPGVAVLERFPDAQNVPEDVPNGVPTDVSPSRASENVPNVPTLSEEEENMNILLSEENVSENVPTFNVAGRDIRNVPADVPNVSDVPPPVAPSPLLPRLGGQALIDCNAAVNQLINFTGDGKSRAWFEKLWKVCHHTGHLDLWGKALRDSGRASARETNRVPPDALGKYFGKTLEPMLILAGVPVEMVVSESRRAEARRAAEEMKRRWAEEDADREGG